MSVMDLSLDDLITRQRKAKGGKRGAGGMASDEPRSLPRERGRGFAPQYEWMDSAFTKSNSVPSGKWGHDKFHELYGGSGSGRQQKVRGGGRTFRRAAINSKVSIHITNLARTVTSDDLHELLEEYPLVSAMVNHDELGQSACTADVVLDRASAEEIIANFTGVAIDGRTMHMYVIDENERAAMAPLNVEKRLTFKSASPRSRGVNKRADRSPFKANRGGRQGNSTRGRGGSGGGRGNAQGGRRKMTEVELDKELDEYMKKGAGATMES